MTPTTTTPLKLSKEDIRRTEIFQSLNPVLKEITVRRGTVRVIEHGINVVSNIGYEKWESICGFSNLNKMIVKEIFESKNQ